MNSGNAGQQAQADWAELGFRCGLEIHHQIRTEKKLFCHCPAGQYRDNWHAEVSRHMRPTLSELGEYDGTALMEFKTRKEIIYRIHRDSVCTYELDDNPPFLINQEAVDIALTIALAFKTKIVGELHIIRKQYLDGSIPAGFQRTCIIGVDGVLPLSNGKQVRIIQIGLEEDSCREVTDTGHRIVFMTDRLSMPLIEVVADHQMETPEEAQEAAQRIARLLRATQMVRRGPGAGRQDVNVSVSGSTRVEIKGVPAITRIGQLTGNEALRQAGLLGLKEEMARRGFQAGDRPGEIVPIRVGDLRLDHPLLNAAIRARDSLKAVRLPNAKGLLSWPLAGKRTFADDLSGQVRVVACLDMLPNLFHTDGPSGGLDDHDRVAIANAAKCGDDDVAVLVWGPEEDTVTAVNEIMDRVAQAIVGVPNETRQALGNNLNDFERVLPGADRMYPDTDSPPYAITAERIDAAGEFLPIEPWVREERYRGEGLADDMVDFLPISAHAPLHDRLVDETAVPPLRSGEVLARVLPAFDRRGWDSTVLSDEQYEALLRALGEGRIYREGLFDLLELWYDHPDWSFDQVLGELGWDEPVDDARLTQEVDEAVRLAREEGPRDVANLPRMAMGHAMDILRGRVPGTMVLDAVTKALG